MTTRRMGPPDASVRLKLLDATEQVIAREGYPAATSRNVGKEAGVNQKLIFYYFQNMEELIVATFRRRSEAFLVELKKLSGSASPLRSLWALSSHRSGRLVIEFMAMATRNEALREEVRRYSARANQIINEVIKGQVSICSLDVIVTPAFVNFAIASIARNLILESELGLVECPEELTGAIESLIDKLEAALLV